MVEPDPDLYEGLGVFGGQERSQIIVSIRDFIEEARKRARSKNTPSREREKWMILAGKLIWFKDQILRSMTHEALEKEIANLKKRVEETYPRVTPRRIIRGASKTGRLTRTQRPTKASRA